MPVADECGINVIPKKIQKDGYYVRCKYTLVYGESALVIVEDKQILSNEEYAYEWYFPLCSIDINLQESISPV